MNKGFIKTLLFLTLLSIISGCRYRAGYPVNTANIRTIYVAPAVNKAIVAQVSTVLTRQIREEILRSGIAHLGSSANDSDTVLEVIVTQYGRSVGSVDEYDADIAKTLSLDMSAKCSLRDNRSAQYFFKDQTVSASISINATDSAQSIEFQCLPQLSRKLSQKIALLLANVETHHKN